MNFINGAQLLEYCEKENKKNNLQMHKVFFLK